MSIPRKCDQHISSRFHSNGFFSPKSLNKLKDPTSFIFIGHSWFFLRDINQPFVLLTLHFRRFTKVSNERSYSSVPTYSFVARIGIILFFDLTVITALGGACGTYGGERIIQGFGVENGEKGTI